MAATDEMMRDSVVVVKKEEMDDEEEIMEGEEGESLGEDGEEEGRRGVLGVVANLILLPLRPFVSPLALRTYLTTILFFLTSFFLLGLAVLAYALFYYTYIPDLTFSRPIHLQFDSNPPLQDRSGSTSPSAVQPVLQHPFGMCSLTPDLIASQGYDVVVELTLPRTPGNAQAGNFMLQTDLYAPASKPSPTRSNNNILVLETVQSGLPYSSSQSMPPDQQLLATSRRPAILPYRSRPVDLLYRLSELHWYLLNLRQETSTLKVPVFEDVAFSKGWRNMPATLRLEVQSPHARLQIYDVTVVFTARFRGVRWVVWRYRWLAGLGFVAGFWVVGMVFVGVGWGVVVGGGGLSGAGKGQGKGDGGREGKREVAGFTAREEGALSETDRVFPAVGRRGEVRYRSPRVKREEEEEQEGEAAGAEEGGLRVSPQDGVVGDLLADDEEDEEEEEEDREEDAAAAEAAGFVDSGLGTSLESTGPARQESVRKRRGRAGVKEEG